MTWRAQHSSSFHPQLGAAGSHGCAADSPPFIEPPFYCDYGCEQTAVASAVPPAKRATGQGCCIPRADAWTGQPHLLVWDLPAGSACHPHAAHTGAFTTQCCHPSADNLHLGKGFYW